MVHVSQIQQHMEVLDCEGKHLGWVDHLACDGICLTGETPRVMHQPHIIPLSWVECLSYGKLCLNRRCDEARCNWH
jgi:hypothetical protein